MTLISYIILSIITSFGLFVGAFVAKNSEEELKDGAKYIKTLAVVIAYIVFLLTARELFTNLILIAFIPTIIILLTFYIPKKIRSYTLLALLGLSFALVMTTNTTNYIIPSLIFMNGLCVGSMTYFLEKKELYNSLSIKAATFVVIALVVYLIV